MPRTAFLFPGQGAQVVGMAGALCQSVPAARALFDSAAAILGYDLVNICVNGPAERLNATDISQPAIFVASLAALEQLKTPFLDLADLDHWVHVPGYLLLSGRAQHAVTVSNDSFARKTCDRSGKVLSSLNGKVALGESVFQREDAGDYELFEFTEAKP